MCSSDLYELLHRARAALVTFGHRLDLSAWSDRVQNLDATYAGSWELPALGAVAAPAAVRSYPDALSSNRSSSSSTRRYASSPIVPAPRSSPMARRDASTSARRS